MLGESYYDIDAVLPAHDLDPAGRYRRAPHRRRRGDVDRQLPLRGLVGLDDLDGLLTDRQPPATDVDPAVGWVTLKMRGACVARALGTEILEELRCDDEDGDLSHIPSSAELWPVLDADLDLFACVKHVAP